MFVTLRHWLGRSVDERAARREYFELVSESQGLLADLGTIISPDRRARTLGMLALCDLAMANTHKLGFGGEQMHEALTLNAQIHRAFFEIEHAIAYQHDRRLSTPELELVVGNLLNEVVRIGGLTNPLRNELAEVVRLSLGDRAAQTIGSIPFPGSSKHFS